LPRIRVYHAMRLLLWWPVQDGRYSFEELQFPVKSAERSGLHGDIGPVIVDPVSAGRSGHDREDHHSVPVDETGRQQ
jgi:hypothetical protein